MPFCSAPFLCLHVSFHIENVQLGSYLFLSLFRIFNIFIHWIFRYLLHLLLPHLQLSFFSRTTSAYLLRRAAMEWGGGKPPLPFFENRKKCPDFEKKSPSCVHSWVDCSIQNVVLRESRRKSPKTFPCGTFFVCF